MDKKLYLIFFISVKYEYYLGWQHIRTDVAVTDDLNNLEYFKSLYPNETLEIKEVEYFSNEIS